MPLRVTNSSLTSILSARIGANRQRLEVVQERISSGKRINRPSDDPFGTEAVLRYRTLQSAVEHFQENAATIKDNLLVTDGIMESYEQLVDRASVLISQGVSDTTSVPAREAIARELDGIRSQLIAIANKKTGDRFLFGGTRQDVAPFDSNGNPTAGAASPQLVQIEPDAAPVVAGITAEQIFTTSSTSVFATLENAANALRGAGDPVADRTTALAALDSLKSFSVQAATGRSQLGASLNAIENAGERLNSQSLAFQESIDRYETADIAALAVELSQAGTALQATIQASAFTGKGSLMDLIG
jgi:flagellar hook-associated protein 3 FlgL